MDGLDQGLQLLQQVAFLAVGLWALVHWRRRGDTRSGWLAATFMALAGTVLVGLVTERLDAEPPRVVTVVAVISILLFPYLLLRFADSFEPVDRRFLRATGVVVGVLVVWTPFIEFAEPGAPRTVPMLVFTLGIVATWTTALPLVASRFWRAAAGQPTVVRRRMQLLSVGTVALSLALLVAASPEAATPAVTRVVDVLAVASSWLFLVGFSPPSGLRMRWRQPEEARAHEAAVALMGASTPEEVATLLVPHIRSLTAARGVELHHGGALRAAAGSNDAGSEAPLVVPITGGVIHVLPDAYTPFFGPEEYALLERLAVLAELALDRTTLLATEQAVRAELEVANAELESFLYTVSHDLKSPMIAMLSYVDVLTQDYSDVLDDEGRWYLQRMASNGRYMEALVGDLLELSRVGRVDTMPEWVDLAELARDVGEELAHQHGATVDVGSLPAVLLNPLRVRQLLRNLIENAAVYGGDDVTIRVEAGPVGDDGVRLLVRDDGPGIPDRYRERIFGVFERLDVDKEGTGVGLAVCRKIVEAAGGRIWVTDHPGGAEFAIDLPATIVAPVGDVPPTVLDPHTDEADASLQEAVR